MHVFQRHLLVFALAAISLICLRCPAREISQIRGLPEHALAALPDSVQVALLFDKAAQLRTTEGGQKLFKFISSTGLLKQLEDSWPTLATDLGLAPEQAFDELLGRRAIIAASGTLTGPSSQWVLITHVTADVEKSLRDRLRPAARGLVHGFPILAIGAGRYELATSTISGDEGGEEKLSTVILSPSGGILFDEVLKSLATRSPVEDTSPLPMPKLKGRVDSMLMLRNPETARRTIFAATIGMQAWDIEFASDNTKGIAVPTLPAAVTARLYADPELTYFAAASAHGDSTSLSGFAFLDQVLWSLIPLDKPSREAFANGAAITLSSNQSVSWALPVDESARAASVADRSMSMLFSAIDRAGPGFHGEAPEAVRTVRTSLPVVNPLARLMDPQVDLQWSIQTAADNRAWWFASCQPVNTPDPAFKSFPPNCVYYLSVRPELAITSIGSPKLLETAPLSALKQIRLIQFAAFADPSHGPTWCVGSGRIELVP